WLAVLHGDIDPPELGHKERLLVKEAVTAAETLDWSVDPWRTLTERLKQTSGKKGRELFHPLRLALTGRESGPEMAGLIAEMGRDRAVRRLEAAARRSRCCESGGRGCSPLSLPDVLVPQTFESDRRV